MAILHFFLLSMCGVCLGEKLEFSAQQKIIPVFLEPDDLFGPAAAVVMISMFENANSNTFYQVYLLVPDSFENEKKVKIAHLKEKYKSCEINFINMGDQFKEYRSYYFTPSTLYDLRAASILTNHNKCIYLDCDVVVRHDLSEMYNINMDNYYYAGVHDLGVRKGIEKVLEIPNLNQYICTGVMIINLEKIRKDKLEEKYLRLFESTVGKKFFIFEQDCINSLGYGKLLNLPLRFGFLVNLVDLNASYEKIGKAKMFLTRDEWKAKDPTIAHFASFPKPWEHYSKTIFHEEFWVYARKAGLDGELEEMASRRRALDEKFEPERLEESEKRVRMLRRLNKK